MSIKKRILSAFTALALAVGALSFAGCSQNVNYAMEIDGEKIAAGLYILYSGQALNDAEAKVREENPDLKTTEEGFSYYDQKVGDMDFGDYVKQEAENYCKRHIAIEKLYDELNIKLEEDESDDLSKSIANQWDYGVSSWASSLTYLGNHKTLGSYYESIGVSKSSFREFVTNSLKASKIFTYYYGEGGIEEVSKEEKEQWLDENYSLVRYFGVSITDSDNKVIESKTQLAILENLANDYAKKLNEGSAYKDVYKEYQAYVSEQNTTTGSGTSTAAPETTTEAATEAEANARAAEGTEAVSETASPNETEPEEAVTTATAEETAPVEATDGTTVTTATVNEGTTPVSEATSPAETTAAQTGADTATGAETTTSAATTTTEVKDSDYDRIIAKDSTTPSKEFVTELFSKEKNNAYVFKADTYYYVVQKLDILKSEEDYVKQYDETALSGLRDDDMDNIYKERYASYNVTMNTSAPDYCKEQAENAGNGITTISQIQYLTYYYSQMFGGGA